jgi:hypothetical protein
LWVESINSVLQWLVSGLFGGYAVSNVLKWYWWRLNGMGYFWGMLTGIIGALTFPLIFADADMFANVAPDILPLYLFPLLLLVSGIACIVGSLLTKPEEPEILKSFYSHVRPWGLWGPVHKMVLEDDPGFKRNENFKLDMFNVAIGIIAQTCLVAAPIFLVIRENVSLAGTLAVFGVCALILKKTWFDKLDGEPANG